MAINENIEVKNSTKQTKTKQPKIDKEKEELEKKIKEQEAQMKELQEKINLLLAGSLMKDKEEKNESDFVRDED